ncbi:hypothetical protein P5673_021343 [Acropora cervicornis]|uniref:Uncharacterized protein n=1 Tax=Acropora cervicornis TaxID=6130 RepID=A0AAD9Q865_ACRCE|nr:hypothetical protein P5673_021343 [Acropora cervicornis]
MVKKLRYSLRSQGATLLCKCLYIAAFRLHNSFHIRHTLEKRHYL